MRAQMSPLIEILLTLVSGGLAIAAASVGAWHWQPALVELISFLLSEHPYLTGCWLALAVIGIDFGMVAARDTVGYRGVGSKSRAHWHLTRGQR